jgi:integrase
MSRDTSARPHELLKLKIGDIAFKTSPSGVQYAQIVISGKTTQRVVPIINSISYLKSWLAVHPMKSSPEAPLFVGFGRSMGKAITPGGLLNYYNHHLKKGSRAHGKFYEGYFPRLLKSETVSEEDKKAIEKLLQKPFWNPYIRRHTSLTEKVQLIKNEFVLKQHAGWGLTSKMVNRYTHFLGTESSNAILEEMGILPKKGETPNKLQPKVCPHCSEPNSYDAPICIKCKMVLTFGAYGRAIEDEKKLVEDLVEKKVQAILRRVDISKLKYG